jgi:hypothetical protein
MRIHCNSCQQPITDSLYLRSKLVGTRHTEYEPDGTPLYSYVKYTMPKGAFTRLRNGKPVIVLDRKSLTIPYPEYRSGWGCCDLDWVEVRCTCGEVLGYMQYDCWQTMNCVILDVHKVEARNLCYITRRFRIN